MPIPVQQFPILTPGQMNPFNEAMQSGLTNFQNGLRSAYMPSQLQADLLKQQLANQISGVQAKFAEPLTQQQLQKAILDNAHQQLVNQFTPEDYRTTFASRNAQTGLAGQEAAKIRYQLSHPGYMAGGNAAELEYLKSLGIDINSFNNGAQVASDNLGSPTTSNVQPGMGAPSAQFSRNPVANALINKIVYGNYMDPQQQAQVENIKRQQDLSTNSYGKSLEEAQAASNNALDMDKNIDRAIELYQDPKMTYKGTGVFGSGETPTTGVAAGMRSLWHNFAPESEFDTIANTIQAGLIPSLHAKQLTNQELKFLGSLKINRAMPLETIRNRAQFYHAANIRTQEYQPFLNAAQNMMVDGQPVLKQTADELFRKYKEQRPIIDTKNKSINNEYANTWNDYLTPEAVRAVRQGRNFEVISDSDIKHTAKTHNMTEEQVRKALKEQGRL